MESRKMVLMNYLQGRNRDADRTDFGQSRGGEGRMN